VGFWLLALTLVSRERPATRPLTDDVGTLSGVVVKGRVAGASVSVFRLSGAELGAEVGRAHTAEDGSFRVGVGAAVGPFLVVASYGQFIDEATGALVPLNAGELTALVPDFPVATHLEGLAVSPISHLTAGLALRYVRAEGQPLPDAPMPTPPPTCTPTSAAWTGRTSSPVTHMEPSGMSGR
jgi:hypothetical protein